MTSIASNIHSYHDLTSDKLARDLFVRAVKQLAPHILTSAPNIHAFVAGKFGFGPDVQVNFSNMIEATQNEDQLGSLALEKCFSLVN